MVRIGFIVEGDNGLYLDSGYHWKQCFNMSEIHVHSSEDLGDILATAEAWEIKPARLYYAQYDNDAPTESRVTLLGNESILVTVPNIKVE